MRMKLQEFFKSRYGADNFSRFINVITITLLVLGVLTVRVFFYLGVVLLIYNYFRIFSKNKYKRSAENYAYLTYKQKLKSWFVLRKQHLLQRKTHRFYKCPSCHKKLRVPKGKGKISISCPECKTSFIKKT